MLQNRQTCILGTRITYAPHCCARTFAPHFTRCCTHVPAPPQAHILPNAERPFFLTGLQHAEYVMPVRFP